MAKKIQVQEFRGAHYLAGCMFCNFAVGINTKETPFASDVRKAVRKHVRETGHECWIETATTWHYSLLEDK